jgi:hypothetical protein
MLIEQLADLTQPQRDRLAVVGLSGVKNNVLALGYRAPDQSKGEK